MKKTIKLCILALIFGFFIFPIINVQAQETVDIPPIEQTDFEPVIDKPDPTIDKPDPVIVPGPVLINEETTTGSIEFSDDVLLDENIMAEDLGVNKQRLLPTSPYYPAKTIWRGFRSILTFDPVKKAELNLRYANEKLIEAKQVAEEKDRPEIVAKALESYKKDLEDVSKIVERSSEEIKTGTENFAERMIEYSFKQQKLIDGIEKSLTPEQFERVNVVREDGLHYFSQTITNLISPEQISERIINVIESQEGSDFQDFKNIEILKIIEERAPEQTKEAIQQARKNTVQRLEDKMTDMVEIEREKFKEYIENVGGNEIRHLEIINDFTHEQIPEFLHQEMEMAREETMERIDNKMQEFTTEEQKKEFLRHLEKGEMEDIRIIKELENNLAPEEIEKVLEIKNKALDNFRYEFEKIEDVEEEQEFLRKMEKLHDVKQLEIFKEIEQVIPQDKKEFFEEMKAKAIEEMEKEVNQALNEHERDIILDRLAGDMPEHIEIIKGFAPPPELMEEILRKQVEKIKDNIGDIGNAKDLYILQKRIDEERFIKEEFERRAPEVFTNIDEKIDKFRNETKEDEAVEILEKAKHELNRTQGYIQTFKESEEIMSYLGQTQITVHFENAKKHIEEAETAFNKGEYGYVIGAATATLHELGNMSRIFKNSELRSDVATQRLEEMKELIQSREQVEDALPEEMMEIKYEDETLKKLEIYLKETGYSDEEINRLRKMKENLPQEVQMKLVNIPLEILVKSIETLDLRSREVQVTPSPVIELKEDYRTSLSGEASEYCLKRGGRLEAQTNDRGEKVGICFLPDGTKCEQWEFLKGNCPEDNNQEDQTSSTGTDESCRPICKHIGTQSEGWYDSCTGELMKDSKCGPPPLITVPDYERPVPSSKEEPSTNLDSNIPCPLWAQPAPDWCKDGQQVSGGIDQNGCKLPPKCIQATEEPHALPSPTDSPCIQVITYAISGDICKAFPTPCDVPSGWRKVDRCPEKALETQTRTIERTRLEPINLEGEAIRMEETKQFEGMTAPEGSLGKPSLLEKVRGLFQ